MHKKFLLIPIFLFSFGIISAQDIKKYVYKGTVDQRPVTLYLQEEISGCGPKFYCGMYQYDKVSNWLYLEISDGEGDRLVMVEGGITGIISVKKSGNTLEGFWISPDGKRKLNVSLKETSIPKKTMETIQQKYEDLNYEMNDC